MKAVKPLEGIPTIGEAYSNFADSLRCKATLKSYYYCLSKYAAYRNLVDYDNMIAQDQTNIKLAEACLKEFLLGLKKRGVSQSYMSSYLKSLKHFYSMNDVVLNWRKISKFASVMESEVVRPRDRAYSHAEIAKILEHCNPKMRAIVLLLASTGIRVGAVGPLRLRNWQSVPRADTTDIKINIFQLTIYENSNEEYFCFCTPEASKAINAYLDYRKKAGEPLGPNSPLFRQDFDPEDQFQVRHKILPLSGRAISCRLQAILDRAGVSPRQRLTEGQTAGRVRKPVMLAHGFRKFANTQMVQADMKGAAKEMLLGHSIGLDDKYYRPTPEQLLDEYLKAIDLLTINEENRLRRKVEELTAIRTSDISELKAQLDELRDMFTTTKK